MQEIERRVADLTAEIEQAWNDAAYPGDAAISAGFDLEGDVEQHMLGKLWRDLPVPFAQRLAWGDGIDQLRPAAFAYYLPAFLILALTDSSAQDALCRLMLPPRAEDRARWSLDRFWEHVDYLTESQKRVVGKLLVYWKERDWLSDKDWSAVLEYWDRYLPETRQV
jgi:uncharacterized protein DUF6714